MMLAVLPAVGVAQAVMVLVGQHLQQTSRPRGRSLIWSGVQVSAMYIDRRGDIFTDTDFYLSWFKTRTTPLLGDGQHDRTYL